jgi:hypothetical protein
LISYFPIIADVTPIAENFGQKEFKKKTGKTENFSRGEARSSFMIKKLGRPKNNSIELAGPKIPHRRSPPKDYKSPFTSDSSIGGISKYTLGEPVTHIDPSVFLTSGGYLLPPYSEGLHGFEIQLLRAASVKDGVILQLQVFQLTQSIYIYVLYALL